MRRTALPFLLAILWLSPLPAAADSLAPATFHGDQLTLRDLVGEITIITDPNARTILVEAEGTAEELALVEIKADGGGALVARKSRRTNVSNWRVDTDDVHYRITLPRQGSVTVDDMVGKLVIGDLDGNLDARITSAADIETGRLNAASLSIAGAAGVKLGPVSGPLALAIAGAGDVDIAAAGGGVQITISGFGNIDVAQVRGPVAVRVSGVADVKLRDGETERLEVNVSGMGGVEFTGNAAERQISSSGLSHVRINGERVN